MNVEFNLVGQTLADLDTAIETSIDKLLLSQNINVIPKTWGLSYAITSLEVFVEKEYKSLCTEVLEYINLQNKYGSIFNKNVDIEIQMSFVEMIAWVKNKIPESLQPCISFKAIMVYQELNPGDAVDSLFDKFGDDANKALDIYIKSFQAKSNDLFGAEELIN